VEDRRPLVLAALIAWACSRRDLVRRYGREHRVLEQWQQRMLF